MTLVQKARDLVRRVANKRALPRLTNVELSILVVVFESTTINLYDLWRRTSTIELDKVVEGLSRRGLLVVQMVPINVEHRKHETDLNTFVHLTSIGHEAVEYARLSGRV